MKVKIGKLEVRIRTIPSSASGVVEVLQYGRITVESCRSMRDLLKAHVTEAPAIVIRIDTAVDTLADPPSMVLSQFIDGEPHGVIVISPAQNLKLWQTHAYTLARIGIIRTIFLSTELDEAYEYAEYLGSLSRRTRDSSMSDSDLAALEAP